MSTTPLQNLLVSLAKGYVGITEITGNLGFHDTAFEAKMRAIGWVPPDAWCAALVKLVMTEAVTQLDPAAVHLVRSYFSLNAVEMYENCARSPEYHVSQTPQIGSIVIWRDGNSQQGHAGIVIALTPTGFISVEGNTTDPLHPIAGMSAREGYIVAEHTHIWPNPNAQLAGLHVLGFISVNRIA